MTNKEDAITAEYLRSVLNYDEFSGLFRWKNHKVIEVDTKAGCVNKRGYVQIYLKNKPYTAHRLAWLYMTGEWPPNQIDHIDRMRTNNKFANLRLANSSQNRRNSQKRLNKLGFIGIRKSKRYNGYIARIGVNGKTHYIGSYKTPEEAYMAYSETAKALHGEFWSEK